MDTQPIAKENYSSVLKTFSRTLLREAHVLTKHPDLLWQQMYNRLQWEKEAEPILIPELESRIRNGQFWLELKTPFRESSSHVRTLEGHTDAVLSCEFSLDGKTILSSSEDSTVCVWNVATGQITDRLDLEINRVPDCSFSPDGSAIIAASGCNEIVLWKPGHRRPSISIETEKVPCCACFSPDGSLILAGIDQSVILAHVLSGKIILSSSQHTGSVRSCAFSPDGSRFASASWDCTARIYNTFTGKQIHSLLHKEAVEYCCFSPDGHYLATCSGVKVYLWNPLNGQFIHFLGDHSGRITSCAFSPDGKYLVSASWDQTLRIYQVETGQIFYILEGHSGWIHDCAYSRDGRFLVTASQDKTLRVWDSTYSSIKRTEISSRFSTCKFSPDGRYFATGGTNNQLYYINSDEFIPQKINLNEKSIISCSFSFDGNYLLVASNDKTLRLYDTQASTMIWEERIEDNIRVCSFSPNGSRILSVCENGSLFVWDIKTKALNRRKIFITECGGCFSTIENLFTAPYAVSMYLGVWDAGTGNEISLFEGIYTNGRTDHEFLSGTFSPDGKYILSSSREGNIRQWDMTNGKSTLIYESNFGAVTACAYSPDQRLIALAGEDKSIRFWNIKEECEIYRCFLLGKIRSISAHPWRKLFALIDMGGNLYKFFLEGITYHEIIVSAYKSVHGNVIFCPACQQQISIMEEQLDNEMTCPSMGCGLRLKINPFVIHME